MPDLEEGSAQDTPSCPTCGSLLPKPRAAPTLRGRWPDFPFCSERCRLLDLDKWFTGQYVIPGPPVDPEDTPEAT